MSALTILRCLEGARAAMALCPVCHTKYTQCQPVLNDDFTELYTKYGKGE